MGATPARRAPPTAWRALTREQPAHRAPPGASHFPPRLLGAQTIAASSSRLRSLPGLLLASVVSRCSSACRFFVSSGSCAACSTGCATCVSAGSTSCTSCKAGYLFSGGNSCPACHSSCATCTGTTHTSCTSCSAASFRSTFVSSNNSCPCDAGYYDSGIVMWCHANSTTKLTERLCPTCYIPSLMTRQ